MIRKTRNNNSGDVVTKFHKIEGQTLGNYYFGKINWEIRKISNFGNT